MLPNYYNTKSLQFSLFVLIKLLSISNRIDKQLKIAWYNQPMQKYIHYDPSQEEIYSFHMQVSSDSSHNYYKIHLSELTEGQRKRISQHYGVTLNILESEPYLVLVRMIDI